ncbi:MAG: S8 family serine peptidase [Lentimicrobiaceae bacterium]|jgi:subtilisin family serine protease|nr:S8 family serine peptidase [Lentimicrobiaceae bacterium]
MKYLKLTFLLCFTFSFALQAQIAPDKYWIQFTDKDNSPYSIDNPSAFLSERALERRERQEIAIEENDIPVNPNYLQAVADAGATLLNPSKWLNGVTIKTTSQDVLEAIMALPFVENTLKLTDDPIKQQIKEKTFFTNETYDITFVQPKSVAATNVLDYGSGYTQINQLNGISIHDDGYQGQGMLIVVLDGGFLEVNTHSAFETMRNENRILGTKSFINPGGSVYTDSYHGTSVLSTMGSFVPGTLIGTAPQASYYLLQSEDVNSENLIEEFNWVSATEYADSLGVDVINSSLGYITFDDPIHDHSYSDMDGQTTFITIGADIAASKGILVVNSNGNEGDIYNSYRYMGAPADGFNVLSIGAVKSNGTIASFSSLGPSYDGRVKPDVVAMGESSAVATSYGMFSYGSGTSFASPILAGMAACLWQANPHLTSAQLRDAIRMSANRYENPNDRYGYGLPDFTYANEILIMDSFPDPFSAMSLVTVAPNPCKDEFVINLLGGKDAKCTVYDISGRFIMQQQISKLTSKKLSVANLQGGVYFVHVSDGDRTQVVKLVKQ